MKKLPGRRGLYGRIRSITGHGKTQIASEQSEEESSL